MLILVIKVWFNHMIKNMSNIYDFNALSLGIHVYTSGGKITFFSCTIPWCFFICTCNEFKTTQIYQSWQSYAPTTHSIIVQDDAKWIEDDTNKLKLFFILITAQLCNIKGVGEGGQGGGGHVPPHFQKWGAQVGLCPPPPLLGIANVLISRFAHILWLKIQFFQNFLGSLRSPTLINQYFLNFSNLKLQNIFSYILL